MIAAVIYWAATIPLWFYNDRYYLVLVPAGAIVLALAPLPRRRLVMAAGFAMTLAMGLLSLGGTYAYQRGMAVVLATRNELEHRGSSALSDRCRLRAQRRGSLSVSQAWN